jgi:hypothetical protein
VQSEGPTIRIPLEVFAPWIRYTNPPKFSMNLRVKMQGTPEFGQVDFVEASGRAVIWNGLRVGSPVFRFDGGTSRHGQHRPRRQP